jgi:hypothetical protein
MSQQAAPDFLFVSQEQNLTTLFSSQIKKSRMAGLFVM